ncbi:MAG: asparagine synthase B [Myxococcota bacterium]|nr:asparagine synthase B [Myxococcota bacterium]
MCGIFCILDIHRDPEASRQLALQQARLLRHRGPDWSGVWSGAQAVLAHERLAIVDPDNGAQPLVDEACQQVLAVNGEIYNHRILRRDFADYPFKTASDCEVILPLYQRHGTDFLNRLNGIFAFVLYDAREGRYLIARDPIGVVPLYTGRDQDGHLYVASELKALEGICKQIEDFPPGHYQSQDDPAPVPYYQPKWKQWELVKDAELELSRLRISLEAAVHRQLMSDVPYGVLVSGGLDSSIIAAIAAKMAAHRVEDDDRSSAWWPRLHTFSIGLAESPDLVAARKVAEHIGSVHHEYVYSIQEGLDALRDVIYHIETYDVTSIRASTPMYLMARRIKALGVKMVLSGEGADEIFGGYLYFHKAPNAQEFHEENVRKLELLYKYDCLRANKSTAAWGVEARVPFLDREFLEVAMSFAPREKMCGPGRIEKDVLRRAFEPMLPAEIVWRQKEQFSDGVGYSWIDSLKAHAEAQVSELDMQKAAYRFPHNTPSTKEGYLYRAIFESHFPSAAAAACVPGGPSIACSTATAIRWDATFAANADPSGRAVRAVHQRPV